MLPIALPCLRGDRIELRCMRRDDASALLDIYGDPVVMRYTDEDPFPDVGIVFRMLQSAHTLLSEGKSLEWAIVPVDGGSLIGTCGLHSFDTSLDQAEVGCLLKQSAWGNGYMKEAINLLMLYAKTSLGLAKLIADVHPDNGRAQRLFKHLGFERGGPELWFMSLADQA